MVRQGKTEITADTMGSVVELADFEKMEQIRARVDELVGDPATAEALKPYYRQFCKRPCFHDEYLDAFNRPNVTLVDTVRHGIRTVEASEEAEDAWVDTIVQLSTVNQKFLEACTPGYYNNEGKPVERSNRNASYGAGPIAFVKLLEDWRADGRLDGLELRSRWLARNR